MKITTSKGQTLDVYGAISTKMRNAPHLIIILSEDMPLADAANMFDGLEWIKAEGDTEGVTTTYEGYRRISAIARAEDGSVRVTLERRG